MQHQYFVKGLGFTPKVDVLETRSYNRIRKVPYTAYNNRSYNINPRDIRQVSERLRSLVTILNKAVKNQAVTMFKYLSIYVQTKQQEETKAQLRVIQDALLQFQHAIQLYHQRQKCLVFFRLAKVDVMSQLKKQLKLPIQILKQTPITHSVFRKWLQITLESKCNRLLRQQKKNMNQFYMFMLKKLDSKQQSNMRWSFKKIQSTQYKHKINKMINNLSLCRIRMELKQVFTATMTFNQKPQILLKLLVFYKIKQFNKSNNNQQYSIIVISNVLKKHAFQHQLHFINVLRQSTLVQTGLFTQLIQLQQRLFVYHKTTAFQMLKYNLSSVKFHQFADIEQARQSALLRLEYKKLDQRAQLTQSRVDPTVGLKLMILLRTILNKNLWIAHGHIKQCTQQYQQDEEVQLNIIKNMSVINAQISRKIKAKGQKVNLMDRRIHLFKLLDRITQEERMSKKQAFLAWQDSVSFPPELYDDYVSRIRVLTKEKNVLIIDIEQLELMNNELQQNVNQVRHTFLSEESLKFGVEHNKGMDIQTFDIQENVASQEDLKIGFEYVNFLKEQNIDLREQYAANDKLMQEEQDQLSLDLEQLRLELQQLD